MDASHFPSVDHVSTTLEIPASIFSLASLFQHEKASSHDFGNWTCMVVAFSHSIRGKSTSKYCTGRLCRWTQGSMSFWANVHVGRKGCFVILMTAQTRMNISLLCMIDQLLEAPSLYVAPEPPTPHTICTMKRNTSPCEARYPAFAVYPLEHHSTSSLQRSSMFPPTLPNNSCAAPSSAPQPPWQAPHTEGGVPTRHTPDNPSLSSNEFLYDVTLKAWIARLLPQEQSRCGVRFPVLRAQVRGRC
jgi:hypothetical protein